MAYRELIKNFSRIRAYMRSFYVYGFRRRDEFDEKSARGYDDERRRLESWLGDYMTFRQDASGRRFFLSVDSRTEPHNPLYRAYRAKSFTDQDIMLHFHLMDMLAVSDGMPIFDIMEALSERLNTFDDGDCPDESTVRRKLAECEKLGLVFHTKRGRETLYHRTRDGVHMESWRDALDFFSEAAPLGVIGDFCRDKLDGQPSLFRFKHHYILNALDGEILLDLMEAIGERREVTLALGKGGITAWPLKLYVSTQTGRQYALAWMPHAERFSFFRLDAVDGVKLGKPFALPEEVSDRLAAFMAGVWGVACGEGQRTYRLEMTILAGADEPHIFRRLEREKRCGRVERLDETRLRYVAEVFDPLEMLPWIRTFTGRIESLWCDDSRVTERFARDMETLAGMYGGGEDAVP